MRIRAGDVTDLRAVVTMFDEAVAWMVSRGNTDQWGTQPWSEQPQRIEHAKGVLAQGEVWIAEQDEEPVGVLVISGVPGPHIEPAGEPEVYVRLLLTSRRHAGKKIGDQLLLKAREQAVASGVSLVRVDCYAGGTGDLIRYYERNGFAREKTFKAIDGWPGQVLSMRL